MSKKKCPICGTEMKIDTRVVCTSMPPKYRCVCPSCYYLGFINTSEYDQYKEETSLPSNLDEAAEEYGRKEYSHAIHFWDEGLSKNKPEVMKEDFVDAFKAGAEWMAGQGYIKEGIARPDDCEIWVNFTDTDIRDGDEVIVQIRKKQNPAKA